jgi:hypothetical protein
MKGRRQRLLDARGLGHQPHPYCRMVRLIASCLRSKSGSHVRSLMPSGAAAGLSPGVWLEALSKAVAIIQMCHLRAVRQRPNR